jgi:hypothetical protein
VRSTRWFVALAGALALMAGCLPPGPRDMTRDEDQETDVLQDGEVDAGRDLDESQQQQDDGTYDESK